MFAQRNYNVDPLKDAIPVIRVLEEVAGVNVKNNRFSCWLHHDRNPSGRVKDFYYWHCFSCGAGGSIYDVAMLTMNLPFPQAKKYLYQHYGFAEPDFNGEEAREAIERVRRERGQKEAFQRRVATVYELLATVYRTINNRLQSHEDYLEYGSLESTVQAIEAILDELQSGDKKRQQVALDVVAGW